MPRRLVRLAQRAHPLSQCPRYAARMIPLDLLIALLPTIVLGGLWLADRVRR